MDDLIEFLRDLDAQIQGVECPNCHQQGGWDWKTGPPEPEITCRGCGFRRYVKEEESDG